MVLSVNCEFNKISVLKEIKFVQETKSFLKCIEKKLKTRF